ncbi:MULTISPECIES: hypothetical protein [Azorhizobium]|uniref:Uncharacterized protein n=1 Tax=Azorhizobium caulinodans (strain ATCC 43989 / DSM 5975 / JCM 20966 / LMG 6465 / NBRC 14845 / NCIMB 13405 / ORS 571) TaxID=438753 RepID=A8ILV7_AZOC5|nr:MULTISPECIES: hypothetical protein [Azorhizobium]TDT96561.1 hypothetical protein DFO45_1755 [Azorhizobium sp. AG788]BAF86424.1 hypothetical protein AZC_0426 [Azorhizobium caulinodans ORS 571]
MPQSSIRPVRADVASGKRRSLGAIAAVTCAGLLLAACATTEAPPPPPPPGPPQYTSPIPASSLVGRYGLAAYHRPEDAGRTEAQARAQCSNPYIITAGPNGGVMMYLADDPKLTEVVSKAAGGPTYIGPPEDAAGDVRDRQVLRWDGHVLVLKWVDPEVNKRYGTMVYVRCN